MVFQVLLTLLSFSFARTSASESYFLGAGSSYPEQGFYYNYQLQPRSTFYYPDGINRPQFHPELGMSPQYHDLVYNYVKDFAGTQPPTDVNVFQPLMYNDDQMAAQGSADEHQGVTNGGVTGVGYNQKEISTEAVKEEFLDKPGLTGYFLPSDFLSLPNHPKSQFYGHLDAIKTRRMNPKAQPTSLPPLGGVISNYILTRDKETPQNVFPSSPFANARDNEVNAQHIKRQTPDNSDGVVILAETPQNSKAADEMKEEPEGNKEEEPMDAHPGIAQSKPSAIALAGPGGMAQASPVGTALVGQGGLAVAAPSGTAVAGPAGGSIPIQIGGEKQQRKETTEKNEESDAY